MSEERQAAFQDASRGDAWRYVLAWAFVLGYTLRQAVRLVWALCCFLPWVPIVAVLVAIALAL